MDFKILSFDDGQSLLDSQGLMAACFKDQSALGVNFLKWFYLENPFGRAFCSMTYDGGRAVSQACIIPQEMSFAGETYVAGLVANVCTHPQYHRRGLLARNTRFIVEESARRGFHFLYGFPNPASLGAFIKNSFSVAREFRLEVAPVDYLGVLREWWRKEKFEILASTADLEFSLPEGTSFEPINGGESGGGFPRPAGRTDAWHVPFTREQLRWRYLSHPTRRYHAWRHLPSAEMVVLRFLNLYGMNSCVLMKTTCAEAGTFKQVLRDLRAVCRGAVNFITAFNSGADSSFFSLLAQRRLVVPRRLSPRKFPMIYYPLNADWAGRPPKFELAIGDYDAI